MANQGQCFYCFECLSASFEDRNPPTFSKVEGLWEEYQKSLLPENELCSDAPEERPSEEDSVMDDTEETDEDESAEEEDEDGAENGSANRTTTSPAECSLRPQLPSISRLQASIPSSQSSSTSTPSTLSANSSNTALTTPASSTTSFSALPPASTSISSHPTYSSRLTQPATTSPTSSYPLFITWNTVSRANPLHKSLRGCIGTFDPLPLPSGLQTYALTSAFEDTRFNPIPASLLPSLSCSLTLLANFESCDHPLDWELGTHGLRIAFVYRGKRFGATYLPDVAVEQGWTREETVESLMRKAGWDGGSGSAGGGSVGVAKRLLRGGRDKPDSANGVAGGPGRRCWEEASDFRTTRYTGLKASASYSEWREWRRWVEERHGRVLR